MNPQRHWDPQHIPVINSGNMQVTNYPTRSREESGYHQWTESGYHQRTESVRPDPYRENRPSTSQGRKSIQKRSYHISTFGDEGEEVLE